MGKAVLRFLTRAVAFGYLETYNTGYLRKSHSYWIVRVLKETEMLRKVRRGLARPYFSVPLVISLSALLIWAGYRGEWTGFAQQNLWGWLDLLVIPAVLGVGALLFNRAGQKADHKRALEEQRQTTLTTYFDRMSDLLLTRNLGGAEEDSAVRSVAQARTVSALRSLDGPRIAQLIQFLSSSGLGGARLLSIELPNLDLTEADFRRCDLSGAILEWADLSRADLRKADLSRANLRSAILNRTVLGGSDLGRAFLSWADLRQADLREASLCRTYLNEADLRKAYLNRANLSRAILVGADLAEADLGKADLRGAVLRGANLRKADLREATVSPEQLAKARALNGATMPDGTRYEAWAAKGKPDWRQRSK